MITRSKNLDPTKYYYAIAQTKYGHTWLSKGMVSMIYMGTPSAPGEHYLGTNGTLDNSVDWEVREATTEEIEWIEECLTANKIVPRNQITEINYQIF